MNKKNVHYTGIKLFHKFPPTIKSSAS